MKIHISTDLSRQEVELLVGFLRKLDQGGPERVFFLTADDGDLTQEEAQAWLHNMGMHHQVVLLNDPQGIHFSDGGGS